MIAEFINLAIEYLNRRKTVPTYLNGSRVLIGMRVSLILKVKRY